MPVGVWLAPSGGSTSHLCQGEKESGLLAWYGHSCFSSGRPYHLRTGNSASGDVACLLVFLLAGDCCCLAGCDKDLTMPIAPCGSYQRWMDVMTMMCQAYFHVVTSLDTQHPDKNT